MLNRIPDVEVPTYGRAGLGIPGEKATTFNHEVIRFLSEIDEVQMPMSALASLTHIYRDLPQKAGVSDQKRQRRSP